MKLSVIVVVFAVLASIAILSSHETALQLETASRELLSLQKNKE